MKLTRYKLGEILELQRGYDLPSSQMKKGDILVAGSNGVIGYHNEARSNHPCITVGRSGSVGKVHYYEQATWAHNTALFVKDFKGNDPKYLYYFLKNLHLDKMFDKGSSVVPSLDRKVVHSLNVPCHKDIDCQKRIAAILSKIDRKIELNCAINQNLEAMAKQLYDYWFVQFDFPNEEGKPYKSSGGNMVWNEKLKRNIPIGWNNGTLIDIANITMGQSPDGTSYNEIGEGVLFYQGSTDFGIRFPSVRQYTTAPSRFAKKGDILMSVRAPVGAVNIANNDCCIGRGLSALNSKIGSTTHLYYILNDLRIAFDQRNAAGTTFGSITKEDLYNLPIVIPAKEVISAFDKICSPMFDRQMLLGEEIDTLIKQRDELLPLLLNGQVLVNSDLSDD
ncbi:MULTISPECIES: restriction endonuclease subunit S [Bacteroidales]|uniref:restriction endonuclease subunit S n=1 Tax=Bacteroidales TaxID=171549 RepID=UPI000E4C5CCB|nr:restriction endonuclease subunit S [Bacteroides uniformis]MDC1771445.1 restriction endonuclease subunit S [Bacteroides uniformis]MDC1778078.1 restriction endonuclease subunit S [Bacteroides uniformis]RGX67512.1 restriction endonuclease subunit S [Bacteroides uniformis]